MDGKEDGFLSIFFLFIIKRVLNDDFNNNTMDKIFFTTIQSELKLFLLSSNCPNGYVEIQKFIYNFYKAINFSLVLFFFKTVAFISSRDGRLNKITRLNCYAISCIHWLSYNLTSLNTLRDRGSGYVYTFFFLFFFFSPTFRRRASSSIKLINSYLN